MEFDFLGKDSIRYYNKVSVEKPVSGAGIQEGLGYLGSLCLSVPNSHLKPVTKICFNPGEREKFWDRTSKVVLLHEGEVPPLAGAPSVGSCTSGLEMSPFVLNNFP